MVDAPEKLVIIWTDADADTMPATVSAHTSKSRDYAAGCPKYGIGKRIEYIRADLARQDDTLVAAAVKAERDRIVEGLRYEAEVLPCEEDAAVIKGCADLICAGFSYEDAEKMKEARPAPTLAEALADPVAVHANMLRGRIAKPTLDQIIHLYGADALRAALARIGEGE